MSSPPWPDKGCAVADTREKRGGYSGKNAERNDPSHISGSSSSRLSTFMRTGCKLISIFVAERDTTSNRQAFIPLLWELQRCCVGWILLPLMRLALQVFCLSKQVLAVAMYLSYRYESAVNQRTLSMKTNTHSEWIFKHLPSLTWESI